MMSGHEINEEVELRHGQRGDFGRECGIGGRWATLSRSVVKRGSQFLVRPRKGWMIGLVTAKKLQNRNATGEFMAEASTACVPLGFGCGFGLRAELVATPAMVRKLGWETIRNLSYSIRQFIWFDHLLKGGVCLSPVMEASSERKNNTRIFVSI
jgi:hypothetical protein